MRQILQIIFCVLSCACVAAAFIVGAYFDLLYCLIAVLAAAVFAALMLLVKYGNPFHKPEPPENDFMNTDEHDPSQHNEEE